MTEEQVHDLVEKASNGSITDTEELELLKQINNGAEALKDVISKLKTLDTEHGSGDEVIS